MTPLALGAIAIIALQFPLVGSLPLCRRWWRANDGELGVVAALWGVMTLGLAAQLWIFGGSEAFLESPLLWPLVALVAAMSGGKVAAHHRRMPTAELAVSIVLVVETAALAVLLASPDATLASAPVRTLLVAPAALALPAYFGASVGYLWQSKHAGGGFGYEFIIGRRFLLSKSSSVVSTVTTISVVGVALGVWLVLVSLGILGGFEQDLQDKIIGTNAELVLERPDEAPFELATEALRGVKGVNGVTAAAPFVKGEVALASRSNYTGGIIFGINPATSTRVLRIFDHLVQGTPKDLLPRSADAQAVPVDVTDDEEPLPPPARVPGIIVGIEMLRSLGARVGQKINVISPLLQSMTPVGMAPKTQPFEIVGVFDTRMYEFDARYAYVYLPQAQRFFELSDDEVTGVHVRVAEPDHAGEIGRRIAAAAVVPDLVAEDWQSRNVTLFSALKLERLVAFVVLVFIILVASFSIVNTLTMSVIEKSKEIAILMTTGARAVSIMKVFLVQGMLVGGFGTLIGAGLAVATVFALKTFGFWIPEDVYYIETLPVALDWQDVVVVVLAALLIVWDFAVFPALRGSQLQPVQGLRDA